MRVIWVVFSKEFLDIIRDRRRFILTLLSMFVFIPLILILPYSYVITRTVRQTVDVLVIPVQGMEHAPELIEYLADEQDIQSVSVDDVESLVTDRQYIAGLIIPAEYEEQIGLGRSVELTLVIDKRRTTNSATILRLQTALEEYSTELLQTRLEQYGLTDDFSTPITVDELNIASVTETTGSALGLFIPGMIITFGFTAGVPIAIAAIAGEKKKLTLEPVLFTPVSRFQLVFAKLMAVFVGIVATLLGIGTSFSIAGLGILFVVLRNMPMDKIASSAAENAADPSASAMPFDQYHIEPLAIVLFLLAPLTIFLIGAALQVLISTWARNDEEASTYLMPLGLFSGLIVVLTFILDDFIPRLWHYGIPFLGTILSMRDLLSNKIDPISLSVMFGMSGLYILGLLTLAVWLFQREDVVFRT